MLFTVCVANARHTDVPVIDLKEAFTDVQTVTKEFMVCFILEADSNKGAKIFQDYQTEASPQINTGWCLG